MNKILIVVFLFSTFQLSAQNETNRFCKIYLKSGEFVENVRGKQRGNYLTHYDKIGSKPKQIKIELVDSVVIGDNEGNIEKYRFLPIKGKKKIYSMKIVALGNLELYKVDYNSSVGYGTHELFYIKNKFEEEVKYLEGTKKNKKNLLMNYIKDCTYVVDKINNNELIVSQDIQLIVNLYNIHCP